MESLLVVGLAAPWLLLGQKLASRDLSDASLEDLMNIEVTSVSKKEQKLSKTGAAVFVITQEDIRRSGATNIPDLLRMVPAPPLPKSTPINGPSACAALTTAMRIRCLC